MPWKYFVGKTPAKAMYCNLHCQSEHLIFLYFCLFYFILNALKCETQGNQGIGTSY